MYMNAETAAKVKEDIIALKQFSEEKDRIIDELVGYVKSLKQENENLRRQLDEIRQTEYERKVRPRSDDIYAFWEE
jgi:regulator of replication initiation timing